jgi:thiamine monophosphate synthase
VAVIAAYEAGIRGVRPLARAASVRDAHGQVVKVGVSTHTVEKLYKAGKIGPTGT